MGTRPSLLKLNKLHYPLACYQADPLSSWTYTTVAVLVWPCSQCRSLLDAPAAHSKCFLPTYLLCLGTAKREICRWVAKRRDRVQGGGGDGEDLLRRACWLELAVYGTGSLPAAWSWLCMGQGSWIQLGNDF